MLRLREPTSSSTFRFASADNWIPTNAAKLEVTYRKP